MKFIAIIPARYASTRFPGKPLADMGGKTMIQRVYEQVKKAVDEVWVATDDKRIFEAVTDFGGKAVMTSEKHRSGTDRIHEAFLKIGLKYDIIINVQGDEPFIQPDQIQSLMACFDSNDTQLATLVKPFKPEDNFEVLSNPNSPKVVVNKNSEAIYFSRSVIPFIRDNEPDTWTSKHIFYKHIGMYAYRADILQEVTQLTQSPLEIAESLEQLRWIENGYKIKVGYTDVETIGIDTPADMEKAMTYINLNNCI